MTLLDINVISLNGSHSHIKASQPKRNVSTDLLPYLGIFLFGPQYMTWQFNSVVWLQCHNLALFLKVSAKSKKGDKWCVPLSSEVGYVTRNTPLKSEFHVGKLEELLLVQVYNSVWLPPFTNMKWKLYMTVFIIYLQNNNCICIIKKLHLQYCAASAFTYADMTTLNMLIMLFQTYN